LDDPLHRPRDEGSTSTSRGASHRRASSHHRNGIKSASSTGSKPVVAAGSSAEDDEQELALLEESVILKQTAPVPATMEEIGKPKSSTSMPTLEVELPVLPDLSDVGGPDATSQMPSGGPNSSYLMRTRAKTPWSTLWWLMTAIFAAFIAILIIVFVATT